MKERPFKACEFQYDPGEKATIWDWGIWFDDGSTHDWVFDTDDLTKEQAVAVATRCNDEWCASGGEEGDLYARVAEIVRAVKGGGQ